MKISLVGYMASGKTLVGKALAEQLKLPFIDLDQEIEKAIGSSISDLISAKNELYFRKIEREHLKRVLQQPSFVLSCGGGTPCYYSNMEDINAESMSFYLQETPKTLAARLMADRKNRPLIERIEEKDLFEFVAKHVFDRRPYYEMANYSVRGDDKVEQIVNLVNVH